MSADLEACVDETRTFKFDLAEGDDGIGGLIDVLNKVAVDLPYHHITSFDYERKGVLFLVTVTVAVEREQAA